MTEEERNPLTADDGSPVEPSQLEMDELRKEDTMAVLVRALVAAVDQIEALTQTVNAIGKVTRVSIDVPPVFNDLRHLLRLLDSASQERSYQGDGDT